MAARGFLVGCLLLACWVAVAITSNPIHASCKLTWTFTVDCSTVHAMIIKQMHVWNTSAPCYNSEKCGYTIKSDTSSTVTGTHTTPVHHYVDDLTMDFTGTSSSCSVAGHSTSEIWYAHYDDGTNYCNLHNLVVGSGLANSTRYGFKEETEDGECTQYSTANCTKY